jgi:hypothetical protein
VAFEKTAGGLPDIRGWNVDVAASGGGPCPTVTITANDGQVPSPCRDSNLASLVPGQDYTFGVRAFDPLNSDGNTSVVVGTPACQPSLSARLITPANGRILQGARVTLAAVLLYGQYAEASKMLFQYRQEGAGSWTDVPAAVAPRANPDAVYPFYTLWNVTGLAAGSYQLRAVAYDLTDQPDPSPQFITVGINQPSPTFEGLINGSSEYETRNASFIASGSVTLPGQPAWDALNKVDLPENSMSLDTRMVHIIEAPGPWDALVPALWDYTGEYRQVTLENGQTVLIGSSPMTVQIPFRDLDHDGYVDTGSFPAARLLLGYRYDAAGLVWVRATTQVDLTQSLTESENYDTGVMGLFVEPLAIGDTTAPQAVGTIRLAKVSDDLGERRFKIALDAPVTLDTGGAAETVRYYYVYRGTTSNFVPDQVNQTNLVALTTDQDYVAGVREYQDSRLFFYKVVAVDEAGNQGSPD